MSQPTEYPQDATPAKNRRALKITIASFAAAVVITGATWGSVSYANGIAAQQAHVEAVAAQHQAEAAIPMLTDQTSAAASEADTTSADDAVATEQAREAAAAQAQAAAEAAAAAAAAKAVHAKPNGGSFGGDAPAGTPIPTHLDTDPNSGSYGQMVIENPDQFCASNSGTTRSDGVQVCA